MITDRFVSINPGKHEITLGSGKRLEYDQLVVSPGIDFKWDAIPGYSQQIAESFKPYACGRLAIKPCCSARPAICSAALPRYLRASKPDCPLSEKGAVHPGLGTPLFGHDRVARSIERWQGVRGVDAKAMTVETDFGPVKGEVINVIPPQKAGKLAFDAGLTNERAWCLIDFDSFESTIHSADIHVIGDSCIAGAMPKSGFAASSQRERFRRRRSSICSARP